MSGRAASQNGESSRTSSLAAYGNWLAVIGGADPPAHHALVVTRIGPNPVVEGDGVSQILVHDPRTPGEKISDVTLNGPSSNSSWYAAFTMPRHEKRVVAHCLERDIESFLPLYHERHRWKNRCNAIVELPLFPNYFFVHIGPQQRNNVLRVPGVLYLVSSGRELLPIPSEYINSLRSGLLAHRIEPHPNVEVGDRVCITSGPMAGMEGIVDRQKSGIRVVIRLEMIGRSVAVEVGAEEISYVGAREKKSAFSHRLN